MTSAEQGSKQAQTRKKTVSKIRQHKYYQQLKGKGFWTKSYCIIFIGDGASTETIERYIKKQQRPM